MRDSLAEKLLAEVMKWTPEDVARERPKLQALAAFKYDEYQQFSPGMRFVESLALWLRQFETDSEREIAYNFIHNRLIFISYAEMAHLVSITYPDFIRPFLIQQTAALLDIPEFLVTKIAKRKEFEILLRQSLFLGLSDGARIDLFRRNNPEISNEQIWQTYEISSEKAKDMHKELASDVERLLDRKPTDNEMRFRVLFLLDDFSGSGLSYIRKEQEPFGSEPVYKGKIHKVLSSINDIEGVLNEIVDLDELHICIVLYIATTKGLSHLEEYTGKWLYDHGVNIKYTVRAIQMIPDSMRLNYDTDTLFLNLAKKYFDDTIINNHYLKGSHYEPYLGFDQCSLPLVLNHNTPNNSMPLLWFEDFRKYRGLFPRVTRHRREP